jgi:hypothetical protein
MKKFKFILLLVGLLPLFGYSQTTDTTKLNYFEKLSKPKTLYNQQAVVPLSIPLIKSNDKFEIPLNEEKIKKFIYKKKLKWMNM